MASIIPSSLLIFKRGCNCITTFSRHDLQWQRALSLRQIHTHTQIMQFFGRVTAPLFVQPAREMKKRSSDNSKLTLKPKMIKSQPSSGTRNKESMSMQVKVAKGGSTQNIADYFDDIDLAQGDHGELADAISTYGDKFSGIKANDKYWKDVIAFRHLVRAKTLEKKYFKPKKNLNLLTWAAKEQIRFLHHSDPEEWTIESLAKIFPVGEESILKIIKSKVKLRRVQDILQNDLQVKKNWERILFNLQNNLIDSDDIVNEFLENLYNINIIQNALPSLDLPTPRKARKEKIGTFSLIVKDELQKKEEENEMLMEKQKQLNDLLSQTLSDVKSILTEEIQSENRKSRRSQNHSPETPKESLRALIKSRFLENHDTGVEENDSSSHIDADVDSVVINKHREAPRRISLLSDVKNHNKLHSYIVDDCVYDEDGEFLYRIP